MLVNEAISLITKKINNRKEEIEKLEIKLKEIKEI